VGHCDEMVGYKTTLIKEFRKLRAQFDRAHDESMVALADGDYGKVGAAIRQERKILQQQQRLIETLMQRPLKRAAADA
jgi:hypothetical protein